MQPVTIYWRRTDVPGLERLSISPTRDTAKGVIINVENGGAEVRHHWQFTDCWQVLKLTMQRCDSKGDYQVQIAARTGVDREREGAARPRWSCAGCSFVHAVLQHLPYFPHVEWKTENHCFRCRLSRWRHIG